MWGCIAEIILYNLNMNADGVKCVYCGDDSVWKHGYYFRKWFYDLGCSPEPVLVPRYLCKNPRCRRTFSCLPYPLLPYIRIYFTDFLQLAAMVDSRHAVNQKSKSQPPLTINRLKVFQGVLKHLSKITTIAERMCRERDLFQMSFNSTSLADLVNGLLKKASWREITRAFSLAIFTAQYGNNQTPHKLKLI